MLWRADVTAGVGSGKEKKKGNKAGNKDEAVAKIQELLDTPGVVVYAVSPIESDGCVIVDPDRSLQDQMLTVAPYYPQLVLYFVSQGLKLLPTAKANAVPQPPASIRPPGAFSEYGGGWGREWGCTCAV